MNKNEYNDLTMHVGLCEERYRQIDSRLNNLEQKVDKISAELTENKRSLATVIISSAASIVASILGLIVTILVKWP